VSLTPEEATAFGEKHCAVWNTHDLDAIVALYADDVELASPLAAELTGGGVVKGHALREYFAAGLSKYPELKFTLLNTLLCVDSVTLYFTSVSDKPVAEVLFLDEHRKIRRVFAHYSC
jgi:hypothetical protein